MDFEKLPFYENKILFGRDDTKYIVAVEIEEKKDPPLAVLFFRKKDKVEKETEPFHPYVLVRSLSFLSKFPHPWTYKELAGNNDYRYVIFCPNIKVLKSLLNHLKKITGKSYGDPKAPYLYYSDLVSQYLMITGKTLFLGMTFEDIHRMQIDIETNISEGYEFPNPQREEDKIFMVSMTDSKGWQRVLSGKDYSEEEIIRIMLEEVTKRDPDVLEGHNFHRFDLDYIEARAKRYKIPLKMGRDGKLLKSHRSRINIAERTIVYKKYEVYGRHIIDTWLLAQMFDVTARQLETYSLKDIARHFNVAVEGRTYIDHHDIPKMYKENVEALKKYNLEDALETDAISRILSTPYFIQTQIFPYSYQNVTVRGNATRIDSLFLREYICRGYSIPKPPPPKKFAGAYTDIFTKGLVKRVLHVDVASLYPSIMLTFKYFPRKDVLGIFETLLRDLKEFRLKAKEEMKKAEDPHQKDFFNALQSTFKILINSFYGYLGFSRGHFADFDMAEATTKKGREIIKKMVEWLQERNCQLIELDTDGIYFTPPEDVKTPEEEEELVRQLNDALPEGINLELDGRYKAMFSYKMKNYILLTYDGKMIIKGSGLKSRGLELYLRKFIEEMFYLLLTDRKDEIEQLFNNYCQKIMKHQWDVKMFQKSDTLQESLSTYQEKVAKKKRNPAAVYELALKTGRDYSPGDQISYYITGTKKNVTAYKNCKLAYLWDKNNPDENTNYYIGKLQDLYKKFKKFM